MFTYVVIYICLYFLTLATLFFFFLAHRANTDCTKWSLVELISAYSTYSPYGWVIKFLLLQLGGIPPFFFFVVKMNFIIFSFAFVDIFLVIIITINVLLSMFFYLKIFSTQSEHIANETLHKMLLNSQITILNSRKVNMRKYYFWMWFTFYGFINFLSIIFLNDLLIYVGFLLM